VSRIIPRSEWGATQPDGFGARPVGSLDKWLHHSVTLDLPAPASEEQEKAQMRHIEKVRPDLGSRFPYTFAIFRSGRIYQGHTVGRIGAHTGGRNSTSVGIVLVGNYQTAGPSDAQRQALAWLLRHGTDNGWWKVAALTGGHRDTKSTACPGNAAYAAIPGINTLALGGSPVSTPSPAPTTPSSGRRVLTYGSKGEDVRFLQSFLGLATDGSFGPATLAGVKKYQAAVGLVADGSVGPLTWAKIGAGVRPGAPAPAPAPAPSPSSPVLRRGSTGQAVRNLQAGLNRAFPAYSKLSVDGSFGPATEKVVKEFQRRVSIAQDGSVGPVTRGKLAAHGVTF